MTDPNNIVSFIQGIAIVAIPGSMIYSLFQAYYEPKEK